MTGTGGLLSRDVLAQLGANPGAAVTGLSRDQFDVTEPTPVRAVVN
ncbi:MULTISPECIES: hypothetical protein [unclassified Streptomyces]|nr:MULTISPECIES: hypothetical protein [unclassified Streptomyces]WSC40512.1 hypothetical protein OHA08_36185 [Streptomyces sp. NBC_01763]WSC52380.1 hypothetical protein OG808_09020 [Streptomyces sp. NBC_01761]WSF83228.1 hypothetical protein OIE70_09110 [Streptomyces sp. NBC_01744]WSJ49694.1 hypothetical protein OG243_09135 [Streptomyces sp. NBC_01318]